MTSIIRQFYELVTELSLRDLKVRYKFSVLGIYWAFLNPMLMALVYGFVFSKVFKAQGVAGVPYVVFVFMGITFWGLFSNSLSTAVNSLTGNSSMLSKVYFPKLALPTASFVARIFDFLFSLAVLVCLIFIYGVPIRMPVDFLLFLLFIQALFTLGFCYIVSALNVLFRDVAQILVIVLMLWQYMSPVFYTINQIPMSYRPYFDFNPIGQTVYYEVHALLTGQVPTATDLLRVSSFSVGVFVLGVVVFKSIESKFAEVL